MSKWQVITNLEDMDSHCVSLKVDDSLAPLRAFFFEAAEARYPDIIEAALQGVGSGFNSAGVMFPGDLDVSEKPIPPDMVEVYDPFDSIQIPRVLFLRVLLEVAETSLKVRQQRGKVPPDWERKMEEVLTALHATVG